MRVYLARHGKAKSPMEDPARGLNPQGTSEVKKLARFLANPGPAVSTVLHSGKSRARETADILVASFSTDATPRPVAELQPDADPEEMVHFLNATSEDVLAVGHLPHVELLVSLLLTGGRARPPVRFGPGTMVCMERGNAESGKAERWTLVWVVTPDLL
jgi:phosphohistidine phosphatase